MTAAIASSANMFAAILAANNFERPASLSPSGNEVTQEPEAAPRLAGHNAPSNELSKPAEPATAPATNLFEDTLAVIAGGASEANDIREAGEKFTPEHSPTKGFDNFINGLVFGALGKQGEECSLENLGAMTNNAQSCKAPSPAAGRMA